MPYDVTPMYGMHKPTAATLMRELAAVLGQMVDTTEAALIAGGMAPPGVQDLAALTALVATRPRGRVGSVVATTNGPTGVTTTEQLIDSVTFTATGSRRYRAAWDSTWVCDTSVSTAVFRMRWAAAATVTNTATLAHARQVRAMTTGEFLPLHMATADVLGMPSGTVTVGLFAARIAGTGSLRFDSSTDNRRSLYVDDVGAA